MSTKPIFMSKKAISPILATLLLIVIAVAAIVVTYAWIMTYMNTAGTQAGVLLYKANVNFYTQGDTKKIDIDIGNSGTSDTQIIGVYVGTSYSNQQDQTTTPPIPVSLRGNSIVRVTLNYNWSKSATYYMKIVCSGGQTLPLIEQAPA